MRNPRRRAGIPAAAAITLALVLAACGGSDDSSDDTEASIGFPETVVATDAGASTTATAATTIPLPPSDTSDIPLPPTGTGDIPIVVPVTSDVPVFLSVTIGTDDAPDRIESVPLGADVTIEVLNPDASDEYHLQGYELGAGDVVGPGEPYTFSFDANQPGSFILESVTTGDVLLTLQVA